MKIFIDPGHGGTDGGCIGGGIQEKRLNLEYATLLATKLSQYKDVVVELSRTQDTTMSLRTRTDKANASGANLCISCHLNACDTRARGAEVIYSIYAKDNFRAFCNSMGRNLASTLGIPFRRAFSQKGNNGDYYHMIRETKMPSIIVEALFLDNAEDRAKYDPYKIAEVIAKEVAAFYSLQLKNTIPTPSVKDSVADSAKYRVVCGVYSEEKNALSKVELLKNAGFDSFIVKG